MALLSAKGRVQGELRPGGHIAITYLGQSSRYLFPSVGYVHFLPPWTIITDLPFSLGGGEMGDDRFQSVGDTYRGHQATKYIRIISQQSTLVTLLVLVINHSK